MTESCNEEIFKNGKGICCINACMHRAELWVKAVAGQSGQAVDWHYSGGIVNVLYLGDYDKVLDAVKLLESDLSKPLERMNKECGSCNSNVHRLGQIIRIYEPEAHGLYRACDAIPDETVAVITISGETEFIKSM